ncbi:hypothetical protein BACCAP_03980 [Pseudoflavonifractor capillosus ATCC 29799]|uniref:Uncharacterized protein n=1 Tax=Pseudoflavonifractor capillosus ATCC 29799 TaxID=411467 RepID=A6P0G9_9FIRM|nr:hypothetical protein BACCAP_03980 [Pseudoflavonifractor capillosus ATCC 29799]
MTDFKYFVSPQVHTCSFKSIISYVVYKVTFLAIL